MNGESLELLCFGVGDREFAADIHTIREILGEQPVTPVPHAPAHFAGVLNLRGVLVPVLDLHRVLLGRSPEECPPEPKLIVVSSRGQMAAFQVERIHDVVTVGLGEIGSLPGGRDPENAVVVGAFRRTRAAGTAEVVLLVRIGALVGRDTLPEIGALP